LKKLKNGLTSSSAAKGLIARPDLLQAARLAKSQHEDHSELVPSWGFKRSDLELLGKVDGENDMLEMHHMEITNYNNKNSFRCFNENEDGEEAAVERIAAKHQKMRKLIRMTQLSVKG
jgi:hypothetical protein